jgi:hypothetical protein
MPMKIRLHHRVRRGDNQADAQFLEPQFRGDWKMIGGVKVAMHFRVPARHRNFHVGSNTPISEATGIQGLVHPRDHWRMLVHRIEVACHHYWSSRGIAFGIRQHFIQLQQPPVRGESAAPAKATVNVSRERLWRNIATLFPSLSNPDTERKPVTHTRRALFYTVEELPPVQIPYIEEGWRVSLEFG